MLIQFSNTILNCFLKIGANFESINHFYVVIKKINVLLSEKEEKNNYPSYDLDGDIIFRNVTIYEDKTIILKQVNFIIKKKQKVAIIGENGTGKSIIVKTLLGFYDYDGEIYINNHNIKRLNKSNIRKHVELLFRRSIYFFWNNIREFNVK